MLYRGACAATSLRRVGAAVLCEPFLARDRPRRTPFPDLSNRINRSGSNTPPVMRLPRGLLQPRLCATFFQCAARPAAKVAEWRLFRRRARLYVLSTNIHAAPRPRVDTSGPERCCAANSGCPAAGDHGRSA